MKNFKVGRLEKVSKDQFASDLNNINPKMNEALDSIYDDLRTPMRATVGSAGYDFFAPFGFRLQPGETILIPTGFKTSIIPGWALFLMPKSGLGFKFRMRLDNTIGLIDSDYYGSDNEGHMMAKITNEGDKEIYIEKGRSFIQGVYLPYGVVEDDNPGEEVRNGGFDSTHKK